MKQLAIVIPAYKTTFFERAVASFAAQTCKNFTLYVGNDCSSSEIGDICNKYSSQVEIIYHRFDTNLGGKDLVGQWERCINLTQGEPWIWLFSDDDMVGERCVELFLANASLDHDLYHFNVRRINESDKVIYERKHFPKLWNGKEMFWAKQCGKVDCFVVEYIFSRRIYNDTGGFQHFPMAWGSDIATWIKFAGEKGIRTIEGDFVYWRKSNENITPSKNGDMAIKKIKIETDYYIWVNTYFKNAIAPQCAYLFVRSLTFYSPWLSWSYAVKATSYAREKGLLKPFYAVILKCGYPIIALAKRIKQLFQNQDKH